jgi:Cu/Zn superoxide dismutase
MISRMHFLTIAALLVGGCGDDDGGTDAGSGPRDSGAPRDSNVVRDSGDGDDDAGEGEDAGGEDAGEPVPTAVATIVEAEGGTGIMGTVTFTQRGTDVEVVYDVTSCPDGSHPTHIHQGDGCGSRGEQGMHWDVPRGEMIPDVVCSGGNGDLTYTRDDREPDLTWTIGDSEVSDVVGHPVIIHGSPDADQRIGCGVIELVE